MSDNAPTPPADAQTTTAEPPAEQHEPDQQEQQEQHDQQNDSQEHSSEQEEQADHVDRGDVVEAVREVLPTQTEASEALSEPSIKVSPLALQAEGYPVPTEAEIQALFDHWNAALQSGDPRKVTALYLPEAALLPTLSGAMCDTVEAKIGYFEHFLAKKPWGTVTERHIYRGYGIAVDTGLYTFHFDADSTDVSARFTLTYVWDGAAWMISSHHSSLRPDEG